MKTFANVSNKTEYAQEIIEILWIMQLSSERKGRQFVSVPLFRENVCSRLHLTRHQLSQILNDLERKQLIFRSARGIRLVT